MRLINFLLRFQSTCLDHAARITHLDYSISEFYNIMIFIGSNFRLFNAKYNFFFMNLSNNTAIKCFIFYFTIFNSKNTNAEFGLFRFMTAV